MTTHLPVKLTHMAVLLSTCGAAWTARPTSASERLVEFLAQPATYTSPSGAYSLSMEPTDRLGTGGAKYRFSKRGEDVWADERPYTLREVTVTDNGHAAGAAYRDTLVEHGDDSTESERIFHFIILDATGKELRNDETRRVRASKTSPSGDFVPFAEQIVVDQRRDRVMLCMVGGRSLPNIKGRMWTIYRLSTGHLEDQLDPVKRLSTRWDLRWITDVQRVPATPLLVVHWVTKNRGAHFMLLDSAATPIWSYHAAHDRAGVNTCGRVFGTTSGRFDKEYPSILPTGKPRHFDIRLFASNERVTFAVTPKTEGGWRVSEIVRVPYTEPTPGSLEHPSTPIEPLEYLGKIQLGGEAPRPFKRVVDFTFDPDGHIYFLRLNSDYTYNLVHLDPLSGEILDERPFGEIDEPSCLHWTDVPRIGERRFVLMKHMLRGDTANPAYVVDLTTGKRSALSIYRGGFAKSLARFGNGGFVAVHETKIDSDISGRVVVYAADGRERWARDSRFAPDLRATPSDVVVTSDQKIAVLAIDRIELFDRDGRHLKRITALDEVFGRDEFGRMRGRPRDLVADAEGGFLLRNSGSYQHAATVLRYAADGKLRSQWSPRYGNGRAFAMRPGVCVAPDGRLWTSDGDTLLRLTNEGVVDRVLGPAPNPHVLNEIAGLTVDSTGRIYAVAKRSGGVHVFNRRGELQHVGIPDPADFVELRWRTFVATASSGDYYVERLNRTFKLDEYVRFSATGDRLGIVPFRRLYTKTGGPGPGWGFQPSTGHRCGISLHGRLTIVDQSNTLIREVEKRASGGTFHRALGLAVAPNGDMAALFAGGVGEYGAEVDLFSSDSSYVDTIRLPSANNKFIDLVYDGTRVVVVGEHEVLLVGVDTGAMERRSLALRSTRWGEWRPFLVDGGKELWLHRMGHEWQGRTIHRFRLP